MRVLMIGAHQDDNEFRCGGLAHKYVKAGHEVQFLCMCDGSGGHHIMTPEETKKRRANECAKVAQYLGIKYDIWDIVDCNLIADLATRKKLIRYIREFNPDIIFCHRANDYHADHRASGQLVLDASYLLTVPHECPEAPAMRYMPVIMYNVDGFKNPEFCPEIVLDMDDEIETKLKLASFHVSQVYEWLPYTKGQTVPESEEERWEFLKGMNITADTTDEDVMAQEHGYAVRYAKVAARFRKQLIERYGEEKGSKVRYAEAFQVCDYGAPLTEEKAKMFFPF